jgi:PAS domain S-box-containing protein
MNYKFSDLIEVAKVQRLNDLIYAATGIPAALIDLEGTIITCSGWQDICTKFHRVNEGMAQQCVESDTAFANQVGVGQKYTVFGCGNGLVVAASPITVGGEHVANLIASQFLFRPPDRDSFLEQATRFGLDEAPYMEAVEKIPVIEESKLPPFLEYFSEFAALLAEMGLKQLKQLEATAALRETEQRWASTLSSVGDAVIATDKDGRVTFMNNAAEGLTGWTLAQAAAKPVTEVFNIINERTREAVDNPVTKVLQRGMTVGLANDTLLLSRDGKEIPIDDSGAPIRDTAGNAMGVVLVFRDITERKAAEEALRESQRQMNRAQEIAHLGSWELDLVNNRLSWSDEVYRLFGLQPREFGATYDAFLEAVHPDDRAAVDDAYTGSLREGRDTYEIEHRVVRKASGEVRVVHEKCEHLRDHTGRIVKSVGMVHDITERKRAEQELRKARAELERKVAERTAELRRSEAYLAEGQRLTHTGSLAWDATAEKIVYCSEEMFRIFGFDPKKGLPTRERLLRQVLPEDRDKISKSLDKAVRERVDTFDEYRIVPPDGTVRDIYTILHPVLESAGDAVQIVGTVMDITERKRAEDAVRLAGEYNRSLIEASLDPLVTIDSEGKISDVNAATEQVTGHTRWELIGTDFSEYFTEPEKARSGYREAFSQGLVRDCELEIRHRDGRITPVLFNASVYRAEAGQVTGVFAAARDITERKETLRFFQDMDRINRAMQGASDLEQMMRDVLDAMLSIFACDRAFLVYPCDPDAPSFESAMERTRPGYPARKGVIPAAPDNAKHFQLYLASSGAVTLGPGGDYPLEIARFGEKSKIMIALYPKTGKPWVLGLHQCSDPRVWTPDERKLLEEIARRMGDVLTSLLAHRDLHESEERHRIMLQTAMDGFLRTDMQGQILEANETYCRMSGYSEQELLTRGIADVEAVHNVEMISANMRRIAEFGPYRFESLHRRKDGSLFDVEISAQYQPIAAGQVVVFVRDIVERKRAEEARWRLAAIVESSDDAIISKDLDGTITSWNDGAERLYGYSAAETLGRPVSMLMPPDQQEQMAVLLEHIRKGMRIEHHETERVRKDGRPIPVSLTLSPLRNSQGQIIGASTIARDISERKQAQEMLERLLAELEVRVEERTKELSDANRSLEAANKELESFSYSVSHDLRAPLRAIDGFSMMVLKDYADKLDEEGRRKLNVIRSNTRQMGQLIDDLLAFSRLGRKEMVTTLIDMESLVGNSFRELSLLYPQRRVQLLLQKLPPALGDPTLVKEVVVNLLSNAIKFSQPRETATIKAGAYPEEGRNVYFVKDNGVGFDMQYYDKLFGVFQRLHSSDEFEGTGVGPAIVDRIIRRHGGRVWAEGNVGEGATLYFTLARKE